MEVASVDPLTLKRSLVNGTQRLELTGWSIARLDWYKAQGCFTEIIRFQTRLLYRLKPLWTWFRRSHAVERLVTVIFLT
jgi:hypothetical protein